LDNGGGDNKFGQFVSDVEPRLRRALVARYGNERGREATAEALAYAWEHWVRLQGMENPVGYLYRVAQSRSRSRRTRPVFERPSSEDVWIEPRLTEVLAALPERQRVAVLLVYAAELSHAEVAEILGITKSSVQRRVERGLATLRREIGADDAGD